MISPGFRKLILGILLLNVACENQGFSGANTILLSPNVQMASAKATAAMGCPDSESHLWDVSYSLVQQQQQDAAKPNKQISAKDITDTVLNSKNNSSLSPAAKKNLQKQIQHFFKIHEPIINSPDRMQDKLAKLTSLEVGKASDTDSKQTQSQLQDWRTQFQSAVKNENIKCGHIAAATTLENSTPDMNSLFVTGAKKTFAVAYQSCELEALPPMPAGFPDLQGIKDLGTNADGGTIRKITDLKSFLKSDYYYQVFTPGEKCTDLRSNPLIYNFGGKPAIETTNDETLLNVLAHGKDGEGVSPQLGIDCSAYVFTSIATSGLRLSPDKELKPILVYGVGSEMFLDPEKNGMTCLEKVKMGNQGTLKAGDIIAKDGHVAIIGEVGKDPLGIAQIKNDSACDKLTDTGFDFVVYQSSSVKDGVGINKYQGKDFIREEEEFRGGLIEYARQACHAALANTMVQVTSTSIQVDRFKNTSSCQQPLIHLAGEACVKKCY